jgi:glycosyltransferase involved in cell wall biosynthesis
MRLLMYCPFFPPQYSGAAKQGLALASHLQRLNHSVEFITMRDPGLPDFEIYNGFPVHRLEINGKRNREMPFWQNLFCFAWRNRHRFDLLHCHGAHYLSSIVGPISKMVGWRSVVKATMFNDDLHGLKQSVTGFLHYLFLRSIDAYVAISNDLIKEFTESGFDVNRIYHIPNGVDIDRFRPVDEAEHMKLRMMLNLPLNKLIFLFVGVFDHRKNIGWLINEWNNRNGYNGKCFLLAVGPQSRDDKNSLFLNSLKAIAAQREKDMKILNQVDNIERLMSLFYLPSMRDCRM